jgi:flagellar protein FlaI
MGNETEKKRIRIVRKKEDDSIRSYDGEGKEVIASSMQKIHVERPSLSDKQLLKHLLKSEYVAVENVFDRYFLVEPHCYAEIIHDPKTNTLQYRVVEPKITVEEEGHLSEIKDLLIEVLDVNLNETESKETAKEYLAEKFKEVVEDYKVPIEDPVLEKLLYFTTRDFIGFGLIDPLMHDHLIEDVSCDGVNIPLYVWHRKFESIPTNILFNDENRLNSFAVRLAYLCGQHISIAQPMLDASLPDGSRIQLTFGREVTQRGSTFTIRRFRSDPMTITDLMLFKTLSPEMGAYFWYVIENRSSVLVTGGIASGKTTILNCLSMFIKPNMKVVSIEDTPELNLPHENWIASKTRLSFGFSAQSNAITLFDLLKAAVRQRPDFIIVGEIRGAEAYTLFQAMGTGHLGMSTMHADSVDGAVYRLESEPMNIPRTLIAGVDVVTVQRRLTREGKPIRRTLATVEMVGLDPRSREILTNDIYSYNAKTDQFKYSGRSYLLERIAKRRGLSMDDVQEDLERRKTVLAWLVKCNIRHFNDVSAIIREYYADPESVFERAKEEVITHGYEKEISPF